MPQRRAFVVLTVYEVRDLLAQVPDGAEARRLAPYCFDTTDKATGQVAAVVGWLGHAAVEEWGWRKVKLGAGDAGALQSLRIITLLHRGSAEWYRVDGEPVPPVETDPVSPWSPPVRQVWAAVLDAVYDEQDRAKDEADDLEASFLPTGCRSAGSSLSRMPYTWRGPYPLRRVSCITRVSVSKLPKGPGPGRLSSVSLFVSVILV